MQLRIGVGLGLVVAILLSLVALSASATKSERGGGGNAWGTQLAEMKTTASASVGNGNGHAWGLMLADIKGKGRQGDDADDQGEDNDDHGGAHAITSPSVHLGDVAFEGIDEHGNGDHHGLRVPKASGDPGEDSDGDGPVVTPPGTDVAAVPEPTAALLFAAGTGLVALRLRRP